MVNLLRMPIFRLALLFSGLFGLSILLLFGFIYWQTTVVETNRVDRLLMHDAVILARQNPESLRDSIETRVSPDLRPVAFAALYAADHAKIAGNFPDFPLGLPFDGLAHHIAIPQSIRAVGLALPENRLLVIGRNVDSLDNMRLVVTRALELGLIPAIALALLTGALVGDRTRRQLAKVHETAERIIKGDLRERLPVRGGNDDFDRLAGSVNHMLDLIARLMDDMKSVGDNIAHDIRTPLTRVRTRLERARDTAETREEWHEAVDRAIAGLDQALRLITALLRIGEIEGGRRRAAFAPVQLGEVAGEIAELYEPIAEEKELALVLSLKPCPPVQGDRDLLCELLANLVGNAIKFTPSGGSVRIGLSGKDNKAVIEIADTGPGIPAEQRDAVFQRFYRSDASRSIEGHGLGLSLVDAIVKLHGFSLTIGDNHPGCVFRLECC